jgi:hypothetical protein
MFHTFLPKERLETQGDPALFLISHASRFITFRHFSINSSTINIIRPT